MLIVVNNGDYYCWKSDREILDDISYKVDNQLYNEIVVAMYSGNIDELAFVTRLYSQLCLLPE